MLPYAKDFMEIELIWPRLKGDQNAVEGFTPIDLELLHHCELP